ncbi:hypothetical protein [Ruegeria profundi]|uniref:DUF7742 family protein n=1 Tax=Ruegeria profundi TaxID=1685378 RepID=UPI003C7AF26A
MAGPKRSRRSLCIKMVAEAELADRHVQRTGRLHPLYGNGSLMTAARTRVLADEPGFDDLDYCQCFEMVLRQLIRRQARRALG